MKCFGKENVMLENKNHFFILGKITFTQLEFFFISLQRNMKENIWQW